MEFGEIDLFDFMSFLAWTFLNFLAHCDIQENIFKIIVSKLPNEFIWIFQLNGQLLSIIAS